MKKRALVFYDSLASRIGRLLPQWDKKRQTGFTVIEVVVAVVLLALAYTSILQNFSLSLRNIDRVDKKQTEIFNKQLQFEAKLREMAFDGEGELPGEVFLEGNLFRVVVVADESGQFMTLLTERIR